MIKIYMEKLAQSSQFFCKNFSNGMLRTIVTVPNCLSSVVVKALCLMVQKLKLSATRGVLPIICIA